MRWMRDEEIYMASLGQAMEQMNSHGEIVGEYIVASSTWQNRKDLWPPRPQVGEGAKGLRVGRECAVHRCPTHAQHPGDAADVVLPARLHSDCGP